MKNILITGITGSLGRTLCKALLNKNDFNIIGIYNSEQKYAHFKRDILFKNIKCYKINISNNNDLYKSLEFIIKSHNINYIIHSAAMKHVEICNYNPNEATITSCLGM